MRLEKRSRQGRIVVGALLVLSAFQGVPAKQAGTSPVKVFILAGQSNMEGHGIIKMDPKRNGGKGSLEYVVRDPNTAEQFKYLVDEKGQWVVRDDVWIWYLGRKGPLTVGYGARQGRIGPELGFGHILGEFLENQVLIIKVAWGGKSLAKDFRPPSSGGQLGPYYKEMVKHIREVAFHIKEHFPDYDGRGFEIAGFGWHQGWNDGCSVEQSEEYEKNLANFIRDIRGELGIKDLPFVIASSGFKGHNQKTERRLKIMEAQAAVAKYKEFKGTVACVDTRDFYRPAEESPSRQGYHWNSNAETYLLIGQGMGEAMKELLTIKARKAEKLGMQR